MAFRVVRVGRCPSTMEVARELAKAGVTGDTCVVAESQTGGRGQFDRRFFSPEGGLYVTLLIRTERAPLELTHMTACTGVVLCDAICAMTGVRPDIKPVNDVLYKGRKLAGILTNMVSVGDKVDSLTIGIGVNIMEQQWPEELADVAGSLEAATGQTIDREQLLTLVLSGMEQLLAADDPEPWLTRYERYRIKVD